MAKVIEDPRDVWPRALKSFSVQSPNLRVDTGTPYFNTGKMEFKFVPNISDGTFGTTASVAQKLMLVFVQRTGFDSVGMTVTITATIAAIRNYTATVYNVQEDDVFTLSLTQNTSSSFYLNVQVNDRAPVSTLIPYSMGETTEGFNVFLGNMTESSSPNGFTGKIQRYSCWDSDGILTSDIFGILDADGACKMYNSVTGQVVESLIPCELSHPVRGGQVPHSQILLGQMTATSQFLTQDDMNYTYKILDELPDPDKIDTNIVILSKPSKGYAEGQVIVRKFSSTGVPYWSTLDPVTVGVDAPTDIKSFKLEMTETTGGNTYPVTYTHIRWKDPDDKDNATWAYTRLLRKAGSYPTSINDGIVVAQTSRPRDPADKSRDFTFRHPVHDRYPLQISTQWFYKLFAMTKDGVVSTSAECAFSPRLFSWSNLSNYIQSGYIKGIWRVGDQFTLTTNDQSVPEFYRNITFTIAGFDNATPVLGDKYRHSVTIVANLMPRIVQNSVPADYFDVAWGTYRLVEDEIYTGGTLYKKSGSSYVAVVPQPSIGTRITADLGYYKIVQNPRRSSGTNRWKDSILRKWLNATQTAHYTLSKDTAVDDSKSYYKLDGDGFYVQVVPESGDNPKDKGWYEVADVPYTTLTGVMPPLMALRTVNPEFYKCIINVRNIQAVPLPFQSEVGSISETTEDKVFIPSITEVFGMNNIDEGETTEVSEGIQLDLFKDQANRIRARYNQPNTPVAWHLRSADLDTPATATDPCKHHLVAADGTPDQSRAVTEAAGITMVLVLG